MALGAFGAHALSPELAARGTLSVWETASRYHLIHSVAVLGLACFGEQRRVRLTLWLWVGGVVCFSGSLYALALGAGPWLGPVTPLGGLLLLGGWLSLPRLRSGGAGT